MNGDEVWAKCQRCGAELKESDKLCPKCGSSKKKFARTLSGTVRPTGSLTREHVACWSGKSIGILALILAVLLFTVEGACELLQLSPVLKVVVRSLVVLALLFIIFWQRYRVFMFTRWLDRKFIARKTYGDKKKPH